MSEYVVVEKCAVQGVGVLLTRAKAKGYRCPWARKKSDIYSTLLVGSLLTGEMEQSQDLWSPPGFVCAVSCT